GQALDSVITAIGKPVTIGPFVVAGQVDRGRRNGVEEREIFGVDVVGAKGCARLDITDVDSKIDLGGVNVGDHGLIFRWRVYLLVTILRQVRLIPKDGERE